MTNTHTISRRIVAAVDPDGTRWPQYHRNDASDGSLMLCTNVPDLAQPANLHLLLEVADSHGVPCNLNYLDKNVWSTVVWTGAWYSGTGPTRSLAIFAAVCAALGIDTTQEDEHAAD